MTDKTMEPKRAAKKPATIKPGTSLATSKNISALIIKVSNPKVRRLSGKVKISINGLINTLISPITNAANKAV